MAEKTVQRIIIAEDSKTQAQLLSHLLESNGYSTEVACNGREAMRLIRNTPPDLLITDVIMPEMDGYELCREIRSEKQLEEIPVLLLTSLGKAEDILVGLECGADKYMMKPYDEKLLISKVESLLDNDRDLQERCKVKRYQINYGGSKYELYTSRKKILDMMLTIYESAVQKKHKLQETQLNLNRLKESLENTVESRTADLLKTINERRQIESEIKLSELKYRNLIDNALLGVFLSDLEGNINYVNQSLVELLDYSSAEELMTTNMKKLFSDQSEFRNLMNKIKKENIINNLEIRLVNKQEETRWILLNLIRIDTNLTGVILDITEKKKINEKDLQYQEELKVSKERAEESDRQKSTFLANMSSEIKKPLNAVTGFSSLLYDQNLTQGVRDEFLAHIKQGTNELSAQINNMLDLARLEDSQIRLNVSECPLNKILDTLYDDLSSSVRHLRDSKVILKLEKGIEDEELTVMADPVRLNDVFTNLLNNAMMFTESGSITFGYEIREKNLLLFVRDSGCGIAKENHKLIFERFKKVDSRSTGKRKGAGLGLTISRALVQMMEGKMWLESEPGKGTSVYFTIPLKKTEKPLQGEDNVEELLYTDAINVGNIK